MATSSPFLFTLSTSTSRRRPANFHPLPTATSSFPPPRKYNDTSSFLPPLRSTDQVKSVAQEQQSSQVQLLVDFLHEDLSHLFDDQGIDRTAYDERIYFRDPITKHDSLAGYLFNIAMLRKLFNPDFRLHWAKQAGAYEISSRWTVVMKFVLLPWKPELVFTGTTVMGINPQTMKFCSHVDCWDSIKNNQYFSFEGLMDVVKQLRIYKTPDLETPKYQILKRTADYEVRKYEPFIVVETSGDKLSGSTGFNSIAGLAAPNEAEISLRKVEGGVAAVSKFSGKPSEDVVLEKENILRQNLASDGLTPKEGCLLARYNHPGTTWKFIMRNEVVIWLEEFLLE